MEYNIKNETKEIFTARISIGEKIFIKYEFEKVETGWHIKKWKHDVNDSTVISDIFIPNEIIEQILMVESVKDKLR